MNSKEQKFDILTVLGARPQFIKAAPVCKALANAGLSEGLIHTGQHYDPNMSDIFFQELGLPEPAFNLEVGSGTHGAQTAEMLVRLEKIFMDVRPKWVLIYGDTNSTLAGALAACKLGIRIAHIESGLRSFNREMPEEHNRIVSDHVADLLFCPTDRAVRQLASEGLANRAVFVGDTMLDAVLSLEPKMNDRFHSIASDFEIKAKSYILATIHRPYNTDHKDRLQILLKAFEKTPMTVLLPIHPRTRAKLKEFGLNVPANVKVIDPLGYIDLLALQKNATLVMTDSGGIQKEAYFLRTPCVTLRSETEWLETVESGWNRLAFNTTSEIVEAVQKQMAFSQNGQLADSTAFGDGTAAIKIAEHLKQN